MPRQKPDEPTTPVNVPLSSKDKVKRHLIGTKVTIGEFYAKAAEELMDRELLVDALNNIEVKGGPY